MNFFILSIFTIISTNLLLRLTTCLQTNNHFHKANFIKKMSCCASFHPFHRLRKMNREIFDSNREYKSDYSDEKSKLEDFVNFISKQSFLNTISRDRRRDSGVIHSDSFCKLNSQAFGDKLLRLQALHELFPDVNDFPEEKDALLILLKGTELFLSIGGDDRLTINCETQVSSTCIFLR